MFVLSAAAMREADRRCIQDLGIPGAVLMNNAGMAVFREVPQGPVGIVCGKGNNGGDGFVVARLALLAGMNPTVFLVADPEQITDDSRLFMDVYKRLGGNIVICNNPYSLKSAQNELGRSACLVDALLGTGVTGEVRGIIRQAIDDWPQGIHTVAVDLPSGMNADTGSIGGNAVRADVTVTLAFAKQGLLAPEAYPWVGRLVVADIGIPEICADDTAWNSLILRYS